MITMFIICAICGFIFLIKGMEEKNEDNPGGILFLIGWIFASAMFVPIAILICWIFGIDIWN